MAAWTPAELGTVDGADEIDLAIRRADGTLRTARIAWVVRHDDQLDVRSVDGRDAAWYRVVQTRREGHMDAGGIERDVSFVEVSGLDDELDAAARDATLRLYPA